MYLDNTKKTEDYTAEELEMFIPEQNKFTRLWMGDSSVVKDCDPFKKAREIMGGNFISLADVEKHFGITDEQRLVLLDASFPPVEIIQECAHTHILVPYTGLSILQVREKVKRSHFYIQEDNGYNKEESWYNKEDFAKKSGTPCWLLICKTPFEWEERPRLISKTNQLPEARHLVYAIMLYYVVTKKRPTDQFWLRTSSLSSVSDYICVRCFVFDGLHINYYNFSKHLRNLGVMCSRKYR